MSDSNRFKLAGVMGMPIFQSRSPIIHNHWIALHGIQAAYGHFPVQIDQVEAAVRGLAALGLAGCNITLPHKVKAMALMDRHLEDVAARAALAPRGSGDIRDLLAPYALKQGLANR